jgi:hypothetical protein
MPARLDHERDDVVELTPDEQEAVKAAAGWVQQFARTLKTCRLYDRENPTVVRFREDLATALQGVLRAHGDQTLTFDASDVRCHAVSLYPARSREDNLALPFHRDGIRALTLRAGIESVEVETLLDMVLHVTQRDGAEDDLVILIWDADLPHVEIQYVSVAGDIGSVDAIDEDGGGAGGADGEGGAGGTGGDDLAAPGRLMPWPRGADEDVPGGTGGPGPPAPGAASAEAADPAGETVIDVRTDDRIARISTGDFDAMLATLDARAGLLTTRFRQDFEVDRESSMVHLGLDLMRECHEVSERPADREELTGFIVRITREAIGAGAWDEARDLLGLLGHGAAAGTPASALLEELAQPASLVTQDAVHALDRQDARGIEAFHALARTLAVDDVDWLMRVLASSQQQRVRRPLTRIVADICREHPERLAPWLSDAHWFVVRNVVHILGWIGGPAIVSLLRPASVHPEPRVRREVVAALAQAGAEAARPLLLYMFETGDTRTLSAVLHQLSARRDPELAQRLLVQLQAQHFTERPDEERRAILLAIAAVGDDDAVPVLEAELNKGGWFSKGLDTHRHAIARCLARLGTPLAARAIAEGTHSKNPAVRRACENAGGGGDA